MSAESSGGHQTRHPGGVAPTPRRKVASNKGATIGSGLDYIVVAVAAFAAGAVNALAGGGTLITFPTLLALGLPAVAANVTSTVALCPGYLGGVLGQARDLGGQRSRLRLAVPAGAVGGAIGAVLLLRSGERLFGALVPYLILLACALLALQEPIRSRLAARASTSGAPPGSDGADETWLVWPVGLAAVYGGYFGAGLSVIVLAVLAVAARDTLTRLNGTKQAVALAANLSAALVFALTGHVLWPVAATMAVGAVAGGAVGGRLASRVRPLLLRWVVVGLGVLVAVAYLRR